MRIQFYAGSEGVDMVYMSALSVGLVFLMNVGRVSGRDVFVKHNRGSVGVGYVFCR